MTMKNQSYKTPICLPTADYELLLMDKFYSTFSSFIVLKMNNKLVSKLNIEILVLDLTAIDAEHVKREQCWP